MSKRGLGKGLDALLSTSSSVREKNKTLSNEVESPLTELKVDLLQSGKYQPRKIIQAEALEELAESIKKQGIIQPIVVRLLVNKNSSDKKYEIIAGERRWRAAQLANLTHVPCIIKDVDDNTAIAMALIENIQREDLNAIEEAQALERLQTEFNLTHQQIADAVGKSRTAVSNLMRLNALNEQVKSLVVDKKLEMGHARCLLSVDLDKQIDVATMVIEKHLSVRQTEEFVRSLSTPKKATTSKKSNNYKELEQKLANQLGVKVAISANQQGKGKLVLSYANQQEFENLLQKIN